MSSVPPLASRASVGEASRRAALSPAGRAALRRRRRPGLHSIRNRLTALIFAITLAAIAVVYFIVAPSLGSSLRDDKLAALANSAATLSSPLAHTVGSSVNRQGVNQAVRRAAALANARVSLLGVSTGAANGPSGVQTYPVADSSGEVAGPLGGGDLQFPVAAEAAREGKTLTGTETGVGGLVGEAAHPLFYHRRVAEVAVFSASLNDVQRSVALIRRRILIAGAIALAIAVLGGYLVARALSRRIVRLEQAARQVARGEFSAHFPADSDDELGQLALALDAMQRQLAELDSARERFIAIASHELRTPIFSLGGYLELIEDEELDAETRRNFIGQVRAQVDRLGKLTTALLDLSRLEAGGLELHPSSSDISAVARSVTSEFIPALAQHGSHLRLRLNREPLAATCDPERVGQILRILIDNAVVHTPPGTNIVVTAGPEEAGGVRLAVRDFGPGVPRSAMPQIFEPFYTSDGVQGSGLGLAIARELAERMEGELSVESAPGRTVFTLTLPA